MKRCLNLPTTYMFIIFVLFSIIILRSRYLSYSKTKYDINNIQKNYKIYEKEMKQKIPTVINLPKTNGLGLNLPISTRNSLKKYNK